jgi:hypothetical protein
MTGYEDTEVISFYLCLSAFATKELSLFFSETNMVLMKLMAPLILLTMQVSTHSYRRIQAKIILQEALIPADYLTYGQFLLNQCFSIE